MGKQINCSTLQMVHSLGKKWTIPLLEEIMIHQGKGFLHLQKQANSITPKVLSLRLKEMEKERLIKKEIDDSSPPRSLYTITIKGRELLSVVEHIKAWNRKYDLSLEKCPKEGCFGCKHF